MKIFAETERLILREIVATDEDGLFKLDSNPNVARYVGNSPVKHIDEIRNVFAHIRKQYIENGIGRWAVIEKATQEFIGWCGIKLIKETTNNHINYYDIGYRFREEYWGNGYATEAAKSAISYGFNQLKLGHIYACADIENIASQNVLKKCGLTQGEVFIYDKNKNYWFQLAKADWAGMKDNI
jgi:RimJ/RimL family protein N-acetyltransferase